MTTAILELDNVSKTYGTGEASVTALQSASLQVAAGELLALIGPSGSGKSTMLSICGALLEPSTGSISLAGKEIGKLSNQERTRLRLDQIGFIFQGSNLVSFLTGMEQLQFIGKMLGASSSDVDERARLLLDELGMGERANHYPEQMSGGQRQRIAIARALMNNPQLILADEPTASLDSQRGRQVVELLADEVHRRHTAGILVTHDERLIDLCDRVVHIRDGVLEPV